MSLRDSSAPAAFAEPSSEHLLLVRHVQQTDVGPGIAKGTLSSRMRVQWAERLLSARKLLGWSQSQTAIRVGWSRRHLVNLENMRASITEETVDAIERLERLASGGKG